MRQQGNVMLVAPLAEIAEREKVELESEKSKKELAPLRSELIQVNYAKASEIATLLKSGDNSILTERGRVTVDDRTNTLIVLETRETLSEIRALVQHLDIPVRQVLIESRIVIANDDFARDLGVRFGVNSTGHIGDTIIGQGANNSAARQVAGFGSSTGGASGTNPNIPAINDANYLVNLPAGGGSIAWSILSSNFLVDLELSALQNEGRGEVISTPRVITTNGKEAQIQQGTEIPYIQASASGATTVVFKPAVLSLNVTPQITPDDRVLMDLKVTKDTTGATVSTPLGPAVAIDTRQVNTKVMVKTGETVVLGGIFETTNSTSSARVPLIGDIPLLGSLFQDSHRLLQKKELLIFVTPKVLREGLKVE
jgi:type IV pilus assembly protein PilQ